MKVVAVSESRRAEPVQAGDASTGGLAAQLAQVALSLQAEPDLADTLQAAVTAAVMNIPGTDHAGITLITRKGVQTPAATDDLVHRIDRIQYQTGQGPCLDAIRDHDTVLVNDLATDRRWPLFASRAAAEGIRSMAAFQLFVRDQELGALNLYSERVGAFDENAEAVGSLLASHAAVALRGAQEQHLLRAGLTTRDLIGQAKGMLMERYRIPADRAFALLIWLSQDNNVRLAEIAAQVVRHRARSDRDPARNHPVP